MALNWLHERRLRIKNTTMIAFIVSAWLLFIPFILLQPFSRLDSFEIINAVCMSASLGFCIGYSKAFWDAIKMPIHNMTTAHLFITGAWILHFSAIQVFGLQFAWRILDQPTWLINSGYALFTRWELATGLIIMMATSFSHHGDIAPGVYSKIAVVISAVVLAVAVVLAFTN